ncbi:hypothetical protein RRG08_004179 [Elysia crispata]|uniref:Uncharacterized protein n=1 Tax=Elysia crispata TaxID=231223 RepID=A0AAE0YWF1_9GAST|nr:hypothetical protein RRG08_004179 [Elysia crispata]
MAPSDIVIVLSLCCIVTHGGMSDTETSTERGESGAIPTKSEQNSTSFSQFVFEDDQPSQADTQLTTKAKPLTTSVPETKEKTPATTSSLLRTSDSQDTTMEPQPQIIGAEPGTTDQDSEVTDTQITTNGETLGVDSQLDETTTLFETRGGSTESETSRTYSAATALVTFPSPDTIPANYAAKYQTTEQSSGSNQLITSTETSKNASYENLGVTTWPCATSDYDNSTFTDMDKTTMEPSSSGKTSSSWMSKASTVSFNSTVTVSDTGLASNDLSMTSEPEPEGCSLVKDQGYTRHILEDCRVGNTNTTLVLNQTDEGGLLLIALKTCCHKPCHVRVTILAPEGKQLRLNFTMLNVKGPYQVFSDGRRNCLKEKVSIVRLFEGGEERLERQICGSDPYPPDNDIRLPVQESLGLAIDVILKDNLLCGIDGTGYFQSLRVQYLLCDVEAIGSTSMDCQALHHQLSAPGEDYEGRITSPGFLQGEDYPNMYSCAWEIVAPRDQRIKVWLKHFALEASGLDIKDNCSKDQLTIYTHVDVTSGAQFRPVITLCGKSLPRTFVSPTERLTIQFESNENTVSTGFSLGYSFVSKSKFVPELPNGNLDCANFGLPDYVMCDVRIDCDQGEDESEDVCPRVRGCQERGGWAHYGEEKPSSCYWLVDQFKNSTPPFLSWLDAQRLCKEMYNARLVSLNTRAELRLIEAFLMTMYPDLDLEIGIYLGLSRMTSQSPREYRRLWQWQDSSVAWDPLDLFRTAEGGACSMWLRGGTLDVHMEVVCSKQVAAYVLCETDIDWKTQVVERVEFGIAKDDVVRWPQATWEERKATYRCASGERVDLTLYCDGAIDCRDGTDEISCSDNVGTTPFFPCKLGDRRLPLSFLCDGISHCLDSSDETFCIRAPQPDATLVSSPSLPSVSTSFIHPDNTSVCDSGYRIQERFWCDGREHCPDSSDEQRCEGCADGAEWCPNIGCIPSNWTRYVAEDFLEGQTRGIPPPAVVTLDGYGKSSIRRLAPQEQCPETHLVCPHHGFCVPAQLACNGVKDCVAGEDETYDLCDAACIDMFKCRDSSVCLHASQVCDLFPDCPLFDDETLCPEELQCPSNCTCVRHEFTCEELPGDDPLYYKLRSLDMSNSSRNLTGLDLSPLQRYNLVFLNLSTIILRRLRPARLQMINLLTLDLSFNELDYLHPQIFIFTNQLRHLHLQGNELSNLPSAGVHCKNNLDPDLSDDLSGFSFLCPLSKLEYLDLSQNPLSQLKPDVFRSLIFLKELHLDNTYLTSLITGTFGGLALLKKLSLKGNNLASYSADVLAPLKLLNTLYTETHQLCCSAIAPKFLMAGSCVAPTEPVSNCQHLLGPSFPRIFVCSAAAVSILCNAVIFISRVMADHKNLKDLKSEAFQSGHPLLVTAIAASHLSFGVYLVLIASVDTGYAGSFMWHSENWKSSGLCHLAGFLCSASLRMSLTLSLILTAERMGAIMFPLKIRAHMNRAVAAKATLVAGISSLSLAMLDLFTFSDIIGEVEVSSMCIPLMFRSKGTFLGLFVVVNCVLSLMVVTGLCVVVRHTRLDRKRQQPLVDWDETVTLKATTVLLAYNTALWNFAGLVLLASYMGIYVSLRLDETFLTVLLPLSSAIYPLAYYRYNNIKDAGIAALKKPSSTFKSSGDSTVYLRPTERLGAWLIAGVVTPQDVTNLLESMSRLSNEC